MATFKVVVRKKRADGFIQCTFVLSTVDDALWSDWCCNSLHDYLCI